LTGLQSASLVDGPPSGQNTDPGRWIEIMFSRTEPLALELIADIKIVPEVQHKGRTRAFSLAPVGTGPMKVATVESDRLVLEAVESLEDEAVPLRISLVGVSDGAQGLTLLRRGEVQILAEVSPVHLPFELTKPGMAPRFLAFHLTPPQYELLVYNMRRSPQAQSRLRTALDEALPRSVVDEAYRSIARPIRAPVDVDDPSPVDLSALETAGASAAWGTAGLPPAPTYDPQGLVRAGQLLDELGWPLAGTLRRRGNNNLRLVLTWDGARGRSRTLANAIRDGLREVGVHVPYATASWAYIFGLLRRGDFDLGLVRLATHSDADLFDIFHSEGAANLSGISDGELDGALLQYRAATTREQRLQALAQVKQRLEILLPVSVLHASSQVMLVSRRLDGLTFVDDLPKLDTLRLGPEPDWIAGR
jgi:ABC-type transport system substrate-binding protein